MGGTAVVSDTASVTILGQQSNLVVNITEIYQLRNPADPASKISDLVPLPLKTGALTYIAFTLQNTGTEDITIASWTNLTFSDGQAFACQITPSSAPLPTLLAPGLPSAPITCQYTPQIGLDKYFLALGLTPTITVTATGKTAADVTLTGMDTEQIELVDLMLGVDLSFPTLGSPLGTLAQAQVVISNLGASRIGCTNAEDSSVGDSAVCHLMIETNDDTPPGTFGSAIGAAGSGLGNVVLYPADSDPATTNDRITLGPITFPTLPLKPYTVIVTGGYYSATLQTNNLLGYYITHADDSEFFQGQLLVTVAANPNPPVFDQNITYSVTVTNVGPFPITALNGTYQISPVLAMTVPTDGIMLAGYHTSPVEQTTPTALTFSLTTLAPSQSTVATVSKIEDQTGTYVFLANVAGTSFTANDTSGHAELASRRWAPQRLDPNATDPTLDKAANVEEVQPGDPVVWTITVRNGSTSTFTGVIVQDTVPGFPGRYVGGHQPGHGGRAESGGDRAGRRVGSG